MCLVKPLVYKHDVGICRIKLPLQFGKLTSPASHRTLSRLHMKAARLLPRTMILYLPPFSTATKVSGATICIGHTWRVRYRQKYTYYFAYLKASQQAHKSFMQPAFGG